MENLWYCMHIKFSARDGEQITPMVLTRYKMCIKWIHLMKMMMLWTFFLHFIMDLRLNAVSLTITQMIGSNSTNPSNSCLKLKMNYMNSSLLIKTELKIWNKKCLKALKLQIKWCKIIQKNEDYLYHRL